MKGRRKKTIFFPFRAAIAKETTESAGWRASLAIFFVEDQLVRYINDCAARIIRWDFSLYTGPSSANFSVKLIAFTRVEKTLGKDETEKERYRSSQS